MSQSRAGGDDGQTVADRAKRGLSGGFKGILFVAALLITEPRISISKYIANLLTLHGSVALLIFPRSRMISQTILTALLVSSSVFAAPTTTTVQESLGSIEQRSFDSTSHANYTRDLNTGKRVILPREEYTRRNALDLRAAGREQDDNKKRQHG
ncbi:hypothetical protein F4775DRAFT_590138 [Biscogniauxia sp. FL1348]|nr:hypothetical protein F4775DRAFT_590138 [Biscogniauxia sp. FL1348]